VGYALVRRRDAANPEHKVRIEGLVHPDYRDTPSALTWSPGSCGPASWCTSGPSPAHLWSCTATHTSRSAGTRAYWKQADSMSHVRSSTCGWISVSCRRRSRRCRVGLEVLAQHERDDLVPGRRKQEKRQIGPEALATGDEVPPCLRRLLGAAPVVGEDVVAREAG
jgi:hypothetical protein